MVQAKPPLVLDIFVGFPAYGGNGGVSSESPDVREWWAETYFKMRNDPRVGRIITKTIADTPITMVRNRFVRMAEEAGCHLLLMVDSDQNPNKWKEVPGQKPFWETAFDEIYDHWQKGPLLIGAPYSGPPGGGESVYVFYWENFGNRGDETPVKLEMYPRSLAAKMTGIQDCAAIATGMILIDMRCFELVRPKGRKRDDVLDDLIVGKITKSEAMLELHEGIFHYEWMDGYASEKASTEDVVTTRDISLAGAVKYGYNPVKCAWDCWIGHWKPWCVGKPEEYGVQHLSATFRNTVEKQSDSRDKVVVLDENEFFKNFGIDPNGNGNATVASLNPTPAPQPAPSPDELAAQHKTPDAHVNGLLELIDWQLKQGDYSKITYRYAEIGCWTGETTRRVSKYLEDCVKDGVIADFEITAVDTFEGCPNDHTSTLAEMIGPLEIKKMFFKNCSPFNAGRHASFRVLLRHEQSDVASLNPAIRGEGCEFGFDLIFIDADHSYDSTKSDIEHWSPLLRQYGIICGHDFFTKQFPGVDAAVMSVYGDHFSVVHYDEYGGIWARGNPYDHQYRLDHDIGLKFLSAKLSAISQRGGKSAAPSEPSQPIIATSTP